MKTLFNQIIKFWAVPLMVISLMGCEDIVEIDLEAGESILVVDGWITDQTDPQSIYLTRTTSYFDNDGAPKVKDAFVTVTDDKGNLFEFLEVEDGHYQNTSLRGEIGGSYELNIELDGQVYKAFTHIRRNAEIDSITWSYVEETAMQEEGYIVKFNGPEKEGIGDNFRFKMYRNGQLENKPMDLLVFNDKMVDGNYIQDLSLNNHSYEKGDQITVEVWSIPEEAYYYYIQIFEQINNGGLYSKPLENVGTNITYLKKGLPTKVAGFFGGASVTSKDIHIE